MIRTERGYAQIFKIYGKSETEVKEKLQDLLRQGGAVVIYTRRRGKDVHVLAETEAEDEESAKTALKPVAKEIKRRWEICIIPQKRMRRWKRLSCVSSQNTDSR
jgi:molybdopterin-biosynthesis enzyme MoeA-like protein